MKLLVVAMLFASTAHAAAHLPLEGYYRPGRCMPVLVEPADAPLRIAGDGIVPTHVAAGRGGVVPVLVLATVAEQIADRPLRALTPNQKLVGFTGRDAAVASRLFPSQQIIAMQLNPADPLPGPVIAWQTLDAVVLEQVAAQKLPRFLAAGITVAVRSGNKPDATWPWKRVGEYWVLQHEPAGPAGAVGGEAAYLPAQSWRPGQPAPFRRQVVLAGALVSLLLMATLLGRSKWSIAVMCCVALACAGSIEMWRRAQPHTRVAGGQIIVQHGDWQQRDRWKFVAAADSAAGAESSHQPVLVDPTHAAALQLELHCAADGTDTWHYALPAKSVLAFMSREVEPTSTPPPTIATSRSPLYELGRRMYLSRDTQIVGEMAGSGDEWPAVVIGRRSN